MSDIRLQVQESVLVVCFQFERICVHFVFESQVDVLGDQLRKGNFHFIESVEVLSQKAYKYSEKEPNKP